jgi:gluconate 5-dehydrogenase
MMLQQLFDLTGQSIIVTGGASGLGRMMAEVLAQAGANVVLTSRNMDRAVAAAEEISTFGSAVGMYCDVTDSGSVDMLFEQVVNSQGRVDALVCNAGTTWGAPAEDMELRSWEKVIGTNLTGTFLCSQRFAKAVIAQGGGGKIVVLSSIAGLGGIELFKTVGYSASKAGLIGLTRQLATEWACHGITVNALAPGFFPTKMSEWMIEHHNEELLQRIPLRRFGTEDDIKGTIVFLLSPASAYMTGQVLVLDGGYSAC